MLSSLYDQLITFNRVRKVLEFTGYRIVKLITGPCGEDQQAYEYADGETHSDGWESRTSQFQHLIGT